VDLGERRKLPWHPGYERRSTDCVIIGAGIRANPNYFLLFERLPETLYTNSLPRRGSASNTKTDRHGRRGSALAVKALCLARRSPFVTQHQTSPQGRRYRSEKSGPLFPIAGWFRIATPLTARAPGGPCQCRARALVQDAATGCPCCVPSRGFQPIDHVPDLTLRQASSVGAISCSAAQH
jgi:hypothetical protein